MSIDTYKRVLKHGALVGTDKAFRKWLADMGYESVAESRATGEYLREAFAAGSLSQRDLAKRKKVRDG